MIPRAAEIPPSNDATTRKKPRKNELADILFILNVVLDADELEIRIDARGISIQTLVGGVDGWWTIHNKYLTL